MQEVRFAAGLLSGVVGGFHCVGPCLGITGAMLVRRPGQCADSQLRVARCFCLIQAGRIATHVAAGALVASVGSRLLLARMSGLNDALHWVAALVMVVTGLSIGGLLQRRQAATPALAAASMRGCRANTPPLLLGVGWALMPCGMVYLALFSAALTGSAGAGAAYMAAFALGTLPIMTATAWGISQLEKALPRRLRSARVGIGAAVIGFGLIGLVPDPTAFTGFCGGS